MVGIAKEPLRQLAPSVGNDVGFHHPGETLVIRSSTRSGDRKIQIHVAGSNAGHLLAHIVSAFRARIYNTR
jgi:hypothetical protein